MSLELIIIRKPQGIAEVEARKTFDEKGGTIGRADGNSWQLPDTERYVSSYHARIEWEDEAYYVVDVSTNGVYINDSEEPLGEGNRLRINNGDVVVIGDYEIRVSRSVAGLGDSPFAGMTAEMKALRQEGIHFDIAPQPVEPLIGRNNAEQKELPKSKITQEQAVFEAEISELEKQASLDSLVPTNNPNASSSSTVANEPAASPVPDLSPQQDASDVLSGLSQPEASIGLKASEQLDTSPRPETSTKLEASPEQSALSNVQEVIEDLKADTSLNIVEVESPAAPSEITLEEEGVAEKSSTSGQAQADELARLLGIPIELIGEEKVTALIQLMAVVLKESVGGLMKSLQVRHQLKHDFQAASTHIQTSENNPLKLSVSVEEALENILVRRGRGYLPPTETIRQSFKDIDAHQKAMPVAMETAFVHLMRRFDPASIRDGCDNSTNTGIMPASKKARYWDAFVSMYAEQVIDNPHCYERLFVDDFTEAYEEAIMRLMLN